MYRKIIPFSTSFLLLLFAVSSLRAQQDSYFPNMLIIKYKEDSRLNDIRLKTGNDPHRQVRQFLTTFGAGQPEPVWPAHKTAFLRKKAGAAGTGSGDPAAELRRIYKVRYIADVDPVYLAAKVSRLPGVEYAEPKYIRYLQYDTDDPVLNSYLDYHHFYEAWDVTKGSADVVIAIVDAGVDYNHPELDEKLWVNEDETAGNGIDDDANGKVDDTIGWDFWSGGSFANHTEDNDPNHDANDHGTHVAGIAAAETDNGSGISGTGFDARYMAVKAGGIPDDPQTVIDERDAIGFGFEGIMYAANNGADIINCSWGGGEFSQAENDVVEFATSIGALVVGAAGNSGVEGVIYPAAYPNTLAVGSVETNNMKANYSNYGFSLDVLATGSNIQSTVFNNGIGTNSGTSMAAPVISGLAALIKSLHPDWIPQRIATQIRATAVTTDFVNQNSLRNKLGTGRIDAFEAVSTEKPGIRVTGFEFLNSEGNKLGLQEQGEIRFTIKNFGADASNLSVNATTLNGRGIQLSNSNVPASVANNGSVTLSVSMQITGSFDPEEIPIIKLQFGGNNYTDFGILQYENLLYDEMEENRVKMTLAADGSIGFTDPFDQKGGVGFIPRQQNDDDQFTDGENLLFEGGLIIEVNGEIYDAVRSTSSATRIARDFTIQKIYRIQNSGEDANLEGTAQFSIQSEDPEITIANINLTSYAFDSPALSNVVFIRYEIENPSSFHELENMYVGLFNDWDIGEDSGNNRASFSPQDSVLYLYDANPQSTQPLVAVAHLGPLSSALAIDNAAEGSGINFGLYDNYTEAEKSSSLKAGTEKTSIASPTDVSAVIASGPYTVSAKATASIGFIYAFGDNLNELRSQIEEARNSVPFMVSGRGRVSPPTIPIATKIFPNYPNPFNPTTRLRLDLSQPSDVNITVYNILGRKVAELVDGRLDPRIHIFTFNASNLGSGLYFARVKTNNRIETVKMMLVK